MRPLGRYGTDVCLRHCLFLYPARATGFWKLSKTQNSRSMRYTCLDVRSPDVNFLRKVMSSSRHDGSAYSRHPCRQSADADIVSAFPLPFNTFLENINILRQTSSTWHRIFREFYVLKSFQKPVALPRAISFIKRYLFYYIYEKNS